jgi:hypothetical protein
MSCYGILSISSPYIAFYIINPTNEKPDESGMFSKDVGKKYYNLIIFETIFIFVLGMIALYFLKDPGEDKGGKSIYLSAESLKSDKSKAY